MKNARNVHIVTVGVSILGILEDIDSSQTQGRVGRNLYEAFEGNRFGDFARTPSPGFINEAWGFTGDISVKRDMTWEKKDTAARQLQEALYSSSFDAEDDAELWTWARVSAELEGLDAFRHITGPEDYHRVPLPNDDQDAVVLLASDTPRGKLAAFWNAGILVKGDFGRVVWIENGFPSGGPKAGHVYVAQVKHLQPGTVTPFVEGLGVFGRRLFDFTGGADGKRQHDLHLSGGFKVAMPYFLALAEWIKSEFDEEDRDLVRAWAIHEDDPEKEPVPLPLREVPPRSSEERSFILHMAQNEPWPDTPPEIKSLKGYAYTGLGWDRTKGASATLTPLGQGYAYFLINSPRAL